MRVIEVSMVQRQNERAGETGDPRENPQTNGIVRHHSQMRKSGVSRPGIEPRSPWWEASMLTAQPLWPPQKRELHQRRQCCRTAVRSMPLLVRCMLMTINLNEFLPYVFIFTMRCIAQVPKNLSVQMRHLYETGVIRYRHAKRVEQDGAMLRDTGMPREWSKMVQCSGAWNEGAREMRDPTEDPPTNCIVRHDSHLRKSGDPAGD
ncbi:hypothetical protein PR048_007774 [Dryococelus australis]|uniref:Uncharacterized protein n=1 Tax=Dryococelus australis TaxID=614101 RepID=A0ABQ9HV76_9NEOP|nr:hypothetical protein PR048_007774 [Dryococelus australis]